MMMKTRTLLTWTFAREARAITCEVGLSGSQSYNVCVVPHWDVEAAIVESYDHPAPALERHAELACSFADAGWKRVRAAAPDFETAA